MKFQQFSRTQRIFQIQIIWNFPARKIWAATQLGEMGVHSLVADSDSLKRTSLAALPSDLHKNQLRLTRKYAKKWGGMKTCRKSYPLQQHAKLIDLVWLLEKELIWYSNCKQKQVIGYKNADDDDEDIHKTAGVESLKGIISREFINMATSTHRLSS